MTHSVPSNLSVGKATGQLNPSWYQDKGLAVLEHHPVFHHTRTLQTSAHDIVIGRLIVLDSNPLHVVKEADRRWGISETIG